MKLKLMNRAGMQTCERQKGFIAAEVAISISIGMAVLAYAGNLYYKNQVNARDDESAMRVAEYVTAISGSLATYTSDNNTQIQTNAAIGSIPGSRVQNPTLQDLVNVANLNARYLTPVSYKGATINFVPSVVVNYVNGCSAPNCMLTYGVRTTDFLPSQKDATVPDIARTNMVAAKISSTRAGVSLPSSIGNPAQFVASGGVLVAPNPTSTVGLIYAENVFDTQMLRPFLRRDGSLPMTGNLNMQDTGGVKHNIDNAGTVNTQTLQATDVKTTNLYASRIDTPLIHATTGHVVDLHNTNINSTGTIISSGAINSNGVLNAYGNGINANTVRASQANLNSISSDYISASNGYIPSLNSLSLGTTNFWAKWADITTLVSNSITSYGRITAYDSILVEAARNVGDWCEREGLMGRGQSWGPAIVTCRANRWEGVKGTMDILQGGGYIAGLIPGRRYVVSVNGITSHRSNDGNWLEPVRVTDSSGTTIAQTHSPVFINWHDGSAPHSGTMAINAPADGVIYGFTDAGGAYSMVAMGGF